MASDYYKGVTITYKGDVTGLKAALSEINEVQSRATSSAKQLESALRLDPSNINLARERMGELETAAGAVRERIEALSRAMANTSDPQLLLRLNEQSDIAKAKLKDLEDQITSLEAKTSGLGQAAQGLQAFGDKAQAVGSSIAGVGDSITTRVTVPIAALATASVTAAVTMDSALTEVRKTVDGTAEDYEALKDAAVEFSKVNAVKASDLLEIEALGAQLGYTLDVMSDGKTEVQEFGEVVAGLDIATNMNAEQAGTNLAQFANITNMAKESTENYGSTIVALGNNMATTESDISEMSMRIAAAGEQVGMSEADILGLAAALSSMGINAEAGGTAISTIMSQIDKDVATSSENVATWAEAAGMSASQFAQQWKSSPVEALSAVISGLDAATSAEGNMSVMLDELGVESIRQTDVMKRLASNSGLVAEAVGLANEAWSENTALSEEVANRNDSLAAKMEMLQNRVTAILEEIGAPVADAMMAALDAAEPLFEAIESGAKAFSDMSESEQQAIVQAVAFVAAVGPMLSTTGRLIEDLGNISTALGNGAEHVAGFITKLGDFTGVFVEGMQNGYGVIESVSLAAEGLSGVLTATLVAGGIAAAIVAVTALVDQFQKWQQHTQDVIDATTGLASAMDATDAAAGDYLSAIEGASEKTSNFKDRIDEVIQKQAELARLMNQEWSGLADETETLERYVGQIEELANKSDLSAEDMAVLTNAVNQFSEMTGASADVIDEQTGKLALNADQIREIAEAWEQQKEIEQYTKSYNDALEAAAEAHEVLDVVMANQGKTVDELGGKYEEYLKHLANAPSATSMAYEAMDELERAAAEADEAVEKAAAGMAQSAYHFSTVEAALASSGVSLETFASLSDSEMAQVRAAFDGTATSAVNALNKIKQAASDAKRAASTLTTPSTTTSSGGGSTSYTDNPEYKALQKLNAAKLKEQQRAFDEEYRQAQKAYDQQYRAAQKAYDQQYRAAADAYSKEQEELSKSLQSQYDARKSELDNEYDILKTSLANQLSELKSQLDAQVSAAKAAFDQQYKETKKSLDNQVKAQRKANEQALKELRKQLEAEVEARREANDQAYDELKKSLDKQVELQRKANAQTLKEIRAQMDAEIEAQRETNAQILKLRKSENDSEEKALRKSLDAQYKAKQKEISKSQKEYTKANSKILKEAKATYAAETKAFKAETSARISAIKDEYAAKKKYLEDNDGTSELDQRIKDIEAEQEAVDEARKQQERAEKIAELQKAVEQAKTRRTRQDAEKALSDYLAQLAEEDADANRERLVKQLEDEKAAIKEETKARQEALDAERDQVIAEYEARREVELEQLSAAQDAAYELLSDRLEEQAELRREKDSEYLESYKDTLDAQLEALSSRHDLEEEELSKSLNAQLEAQRTHNQERIDAISESQSEQIAAMQEHNTAVLDEMRAEQSAQIEQQRDANQERLDAMSEAHSAQIEQMQEQNTETLDAMREQQSAELDQMRESNSAILEQAKADNQARLDELAAQNQAELDQIAESNDQILQQQKDAADQSLANLKDSQQQALSDMKEQQSDALRALKDNQSDTLDQMRQDQSDALEDLKSKLRDGASATSEKTGEMKGAVTNAMNEIKSTTDTKSEETRRIFDDALDKINTATGFKFGSMVTLVNEKAGSARNEFKNGISPMPDDASTTGESAGTALSEALAAAQESVGSSAEALTDEAKAKADLLKEKMGVAGGDGGGAFADSIRGKEGEARTAGEGLAGSASEGAKGKEGEFATTGGGAAHSFTNAIETADGYGAGSSLGGTALSGLESVDSWGAGQNFGFGFSNGMSAVDIWTAAWNIGCSALDAIMHALGIASPSKEARKVGQFFTQGLVLGVEDDRHDLRLASEGLADVMADGLGEFDPTTEVSGIDEALAEIERMVDGVDLTSTVVNTDWAGIGLDAGESIARGIADGIRSREADIRHELAHAMAVADVGDMARRYDAATSLTRSAERATAVASGAAPVSVNVSLNMGDVRLSANRSEIRQVASGLATETARIAASKLGGRW